MNKFLKTTFITIAILIVTGVVFAPHPAHANYIDVLSCIFGPTECTGGASGGGIMVSLFAEFGNTILSIVSYYLSLMGIVLNVSIILTMNIKAIFEATPAIKDVWVVIRNLSSIFIIFGLLYTSIMTILDIGKPNLKGLIGKIILAGLFINFSLFFTKIAIDASNLVSLQFYRAIAPNAKVVSINKDDFSSFMSGALSDPGISDIFMHSLKIPTIYNNKGAITTDGAKTAFNVLTATVAGSILMIFAGLSFMAAAIAFIVRLVILLLLLGFSPIYFVGIIFPSIEKKLAGRWMEWLTKELLFMPVYLLFMYVAMKFISSGDGNNFFDALSTASAGTGKGGVMLSMVGLGIQYAIAFILINAPLLAALEVGGAGVGWGNNAKKWLGGYMAKNTLGRAGSKLDKKLENTRFGNSQAVRDLRSISTQKLANSKFGGFSTRKDDEKETKERKKKGREIDNLIKLDAAIKAQNHTQIKSILGSMSTGEIANLDKDTLTNENVVPHLSSAVYTSIDKGEKSDSDKAKINESRKKTLEEIVNRMNSGTPKATDANALKNIMKNMSGGDLEKILSDIPPGGVINPQIVEHIKPSQLKDMEGLDDPIRKQIGKMIDNWAGSGNHPAWDYIDKNRKLWT